MREEAGLGRIRTSGRSPSPPIGTSASRAPCFQTGLTVREIRILSRSSLLSRAVSSSAINDVAEIVRNLRGWAARRRRFLVQEPSMTDRPREK